MLLAKSLEQTQRTLTAPGTSLAPGEIPLRQRPSRLSRIACPPAELLARRLVLGAIKLIEFFKDDRQCRISRMMLDEILKGVVPGFRRFQAQIRICNGTQGCDQHFAARSFGTSQDRLKKLDRSLVMIELRFDPRNLVNRVVLGQSQDIDIR